MSVIKHQLLIGAQLINCNAAFFAREEFDDGSIGCRHDAGSLRRDDVYRFVRAPFRTRFTEGIVQLFTANANHGNDERE